MTKQIDPFACADGKAHNWTVARMRGRKVRHKCSKCLHMDKWRFNPFTEMKEEIVKVAEEVRKSGEAAIAATQKIEALNATFWNGATVADLRQMAKDKGYTGYSKMKRDDLIALLSN